MVYVEEDCPQNYKSCNVANHDSYDCSGPKSCSLTRPGCGIRWIIGFRVRVYCFWNCCNCRCRGGCRCIWTRD
uniref:Uncharacterized protein n=1 Tax=Rhizophora mucronata TaxID=61149 RepID=A0A2P2PS30_RHIMU